MTDKQDAVILGTMTFGESITIADAQRIVEIAHEHGVHRIDTANVYAGGVAERMLGELSSQLVDFELATKVGMPHPDAGSRAPLAPAAIRACLEGSLRRLRRSHVDVLYLHQPDHATPLEQTLGAISELLQEGVIGAYGLSNYSAGDASAVVATAKQMGIVPPAISQQMYSLLARKLEVEYLPLFGRGGQEIMLYNPLAGGLLSGKYTRGVAADDGRFTTSALAEMYRQRYWKDELVAAAGHLHELAATQNLSLLELAFAWIRTQIPGASVLIGVSGPEQLATNIAALGKVLDAATARACDELTWPLLKHMPDFQR